MTTARLAPGILPREIRRALGRVSARLRTVRALQGLGTLALVASLGAIAGMAADFAWPLPTASRWAIWAVWLAASVLTAVALVVRPLARRLDPIDLAALAERGRPGAGERLVGAVALLAGGARSHGSPGLIAALADRASGDAAAIDPARAVPADRAGRRLGAGLAAIAVAVLPPLLVPDPFGHLARRFLAPWAGVDRVGRFVLRVTPGETTVAIGSDLAVNARLGPRPGLSLGSTTPDVAWLEWDEAGTPAPRWVRMEWKPTGGGPTRLFEAKIPRVSGPLRYRVTTEAATSRRFVVTAVEPPALVSLKAMVEPPAYTKRPATLARDPARIDALEGSTITLTLAASRPVEAFEIGWPTFGGSDEPTRPLAVAPGSDNRTATARGAAEAEGSFTYTTRLRRDEHGIDGPRQSRRLNVRADAPPTLSAPPSEAREAGADDVLSLAVSARDDIAIARAELHYAIKRQASEDAEPEAGKVDILLDGLGTPRASGEAVLGLKTLNLHPDDVLTYRVMVADNRPAPKGPNVVWSDPASLTIAAKAEPILARRDRMHRERVAERLDEIRKANLATRQEAAQLRYAADAARANPAAWDKEKDASLAARESAARKTVDDLAALARDLEDDPSFAPLARPTRAVADVEADAAQAALGASRRAPDPDARLAALRGADARLGAVNNRVEELQRGLDALAKLDADRQRLRDLAAREDALAAGAREPGADRDALLAEQEKVRRDLDALAARAPDLRAGLLDAQAREAADLAARARALAERQRAEARKTAEGARPGAALQALAEDQRRIEADARRLAVDIDEPLAENGRARLNTRPIADAVAPVERGEIAPGRQKLDEAENELRRLARDLEDMPADPRALARRLFLRQDALARRVAEAVREARGKNTLDAREQAALAQALKPLVAEQSAIRKLAEAIRVDEPRKAVAREAAQAVGRALDNLANARPRESEGRQNEAKQALNRLADALPDSWKRDEPARQKLEEARRMADEATRDLDRHLRETAPQSGKPHDPAASAVDLANRLAPLARREAEAADALKAMDVSPRVEPQRRRAERRARALAATVDRLQKEAAALPKTPTGLIPIKEWRLAGPFAHDAAPPFNVARPIDPAARFKDKAGKPAAWAAAQAKNDRGWINLLATYKDNQNAAAFAAAEVVRPEAGTARFAVGSDDTCRIWINGQQVYKFDGSRAYTPGEATFDAPLAKGANRVVVRCGTGSGEWGFGVEVSAFQVASAELARVETIRRALPQAAQEARAALDRLTQKLHGYQVPADDAAADLAEDQVEVVRGAQADPAARHEAANGQRRIAAAIRGLQAPDAPALQTEAARLADAAAKALDAPKADPAPAMKAAVEAAQALADRLNDRLSPQAEAAALARAERALGAPDAPRDPAAQARHARAIVAETARIDAEAAAPPKPAAPSADDAISRAADLAERAARGPSGDPNNPAPRPADVAAAREDAAARLDALARRAADAPPHPTATAPRPRALPDAPADPEVARLAPRAAEARALARRERHVRERLQAILGERVAPQEALRDDSVALGREFADLRDRAREPSPRSQGPANNAAELLNHQAPAVMEQGSAQLAQGQADAARESQRRAAEVVERAAQAAEDLAAALRADRPADAAPTDLTPARDALAEARRNLAGDAHAPPAAAADAMQRAARAMRNAARPTPGASADGPPMASEDPNPDPKAGPAGVAPADLSELQAVVRRKTGRNWGELPGHLRTEILQLSQGKYRDDYARLIQLYFKEIAVDAAAKPGTP